MREPLPPGHAFFRSPGSPEKFSEEKMDKITAPAYLADDTRAWLEKIANGYELEDHHLRLLELAGRSWDRAEQAREEIATEGITFQDKYGQLKPHPAVGVEKDSQIRFCRIMRELNLDAEQPPETPRPPRTGGQKN